MCRNILPKIFVYNPTCEAAIANGTISYVPNKTLVHFEQDLDVLPMFFATPTDLVLVNQLPKAEFTDLLQNAGVSLPTFKLFEASLNNPDFVKQPKESLEVWGWSPKIHHDLEKLKPYCSNAFQNQPNAYWKDHYKELYSRKKAQEVLNLFLQNHESEAYVSAEKTARICTSIHEIEKLLNVWKKVAIKAPWSSSGRGLQLLRKSHLNSSVIQWVKSIFNTQGYVMLEALLDKKHDFSLQFKIDSKGQPIFVGIGFFSTNTNGQYDGNILGGIPNVLKPILSEELMKELKEGIAEALIASEITKHYCGHLGIDCMVFIDDFGNPRIQACVEINLRYNMGILALCLNQYLHPQSEGVFKIYFEPKVRFDCFHQKMSQKYPLQLKAGKWFKGYLPLVSFNQNKQFGAYVLLKPKKQYSG